jgi:hypothetical protein
MSLYRKSNYSRIKVDKFLTAPDIVKIQDILTRTRYMDYTSTIHDYNLPKKVFSSDFYSIPYVDYPLVTGDRLQNIAFDYYGDSDYWWLIAKYNKIVDPMDITSFSVLRLPMLAGLSRHLMKLILNS